MMIKYIITGSLILFSLGSSSAQTTDTTQIKKAINSLFDGMRNNDSTLVRSVFAPGATLSTVRDAEDGKSGKVSVDRLAGFLNAIAKPKTADKIWDEQIEFQNILIDGNLASVWVTYKFYVGKVFSHCGVDSFQLVRSANGWKIFYLVDTSRKNACP